MTHDQFAAEFARIARVSDARGRQLIRLFRGIVTAGVRAHGSVTVHRMGRFTNKWWRPYMEGESYTNKLRFEPSKELTRRMSLWAHKVAIGASRRKR